MVSAIAAANSEVKDTAYDELFAVNFDTLEPRIKEVGSQLIEALSPVYGRAMVGHTQLTDGVVRVDYEGGKSLYINYNQSGGGHRRGHRARGRLAPGREGGLNMGKEKKSAGRRRSDLMTRRNRTGYVFIAPFLMGFAAFMLIPLIQSFIFSFNDIKIVENGYTLVPKGLYNYQYILTIDTDFRQRIVNSFIMTLRDTIVVVPFSFFSALILSKEFHGRTFARAIFFLPVIVSTGVLATMDSNSVISMMMDRDTASAANSMQQTFSASGLITTLFADSLPTEMVDFISTATAGIYDIIIKSGLQIIIFIGGLNTISPSLFESSNIEGATAWVNFWKITFPMCGPYILLNVVYTIIDSFTNLSNPLIARIRSDLMGLKNFGVASSAAWVYFIAIFAVLGIVFAVLQRRVFYHE